MRFAKNALEIIRTLRGGENFTLDTENRNRYRLLVKENIGHTAYCFSTPIYNLYSGKLISLGFEKKDEKLCFEGSNSRVVVYDRSCVFENQKGKITVFFDTSILPTNTEFTINPIFNGLMFNVKKNRLHFRVKLENCKGDIRFNDQSLSFMCDQFVPFASISCLCAFDKEENSVPLELSFTEQGNGEFDVEIGLELTNAEICFEIALYEAKLFQDTTVESKNPYKNNVYGAIGFIGQTFNFGEQWLYSRPDFSKISEMYSANVERVLLHIPVWNNTKEALEMYVPERRFCSFGSTWNNKIDHNGKKLSSSNDGQYLTVDVTSAFTDLFAHQLSYNEGLIMKKTRGENDHVVISTSDNYSAPQILEIKFK